jgi:hypothetical protein
MSKKLFLILLIPCVLLLAGYLFLRISLQQKNKAGEKQTSIKQPDSLGGKKVLEADLRPLFIARMQQLLKQSSNGLYNLSIGNMEVDVLASTISLHDVAVKREEAVYEKLKSTHSLPQNVFEGAFKSLVIEGINIDDALTRQTMDYKLVKLVHPTIHIYRTSKKPKESTEDFSKSFLQEMTSLSVKRLVIEKGTIVTHSATNKTNQLNDVDIDMNDILLDSTTRTQKERFLFAKQARINFKDYKTKTPDGLYQFTIGSGSIKAPEQTVVLQNLSFASPLGRKEFMQRQKQAKELFDLSLGSVTLRGVNWWTLLNGEELLADEITASGGKISLYSDRTLPPRSRMGNFPNQLLAKLSLQMNVARFSIQNLDLAYTQYNPVSQQNGTVALDNIVLNGKNLSTNSTKPLVIDGNALLMRQVPVKASFTFDMRRPMAGGFSASIGLEKDFEASLLNAFTMPLGMLRVDEGRLQKLQASIKGNEQQAKGNVLVLYKDLKIHLMEKDAGKKALDKKDVTSFLANLFVIKDDNPKKNQLPRNSATAFKRDPNGGFFMLVWKTILVGVLKTIGAPEKLAYKKPAVK